MFFVCDVAQLFTMIRWFYLAASLLHMILMSLEFDLCRTSIQQAANHQQLHHGSHDTWDISMAIPGYPRPHSSHNRILGMILAFNFNRMEPILIALQEYRNMCEAGWMPTINFITATNASIRLQQYFDKKTYCYRIQRSIPMIFHQYNGSEKFLLSEHNRECVSEHLDSHDLFIYQEEDTILTFGHVMAYLDETKRLVHAAYAAELAKSNRRLSSTASAVASTSSSTRERDSKGNVKISHFRRKPPSPPVKHAVVEPKIDWSFVNNTLREYMIGFQRYYRVRSSDTKKKNVTLTDDELFHLEQLNEIPFLFPVCIHNHPYLVSKSSGYRYIAQPHQAVYILTKHQVHVLQDKCGFLDQRITNLKNRKYLDYAREYTSSLSLFENSIVKDHSCNLKKISPAERMMALSIEHYYPTFTERPDHPLFIVDEHVRTGLVQTEVPRVHAGYYDKLTCWKELLERDRNSLAFENDNSPILASIPHRREIYLIENGYKRLVKDMDTFLRHGFTNDNISQRIFPDALVAMPDGPLFV